MTSYLNQVKGIDLALQTFKEVKRHLPSAETVFISMVETDFPGVDRLVVRASRAEKLRILAGCDVLIHTSWIEGFGLVPLEAMALGIPVVATDSGGIHEYADQHNCVVVNQRSSVALCEEVISIVSDPVRYTAMAGRSLETAERFDWSRVMDRVEAAYLGFVQ